MKKSIVILIAATLAACASKPTKAPLDKANVLGEVPVIPITPKYNLISLRQFRTTMTCPKETFIQKNDNLKSLISNADACIYQNQWNMVEVIGQKLAQKEHLTPWGPYFLSLVATQRREYPYANWLIELALKREPKNGLLMYQQARIASLVGDLEGAARLLKLAVQLDKTLVDGEVFLGQLAMQNNDLKQAEQHFKSALALESSHLLALSGLATTLMKRNDGQAALDTLSKLTDLAPRNYQARVWYARVWESFLRNDNEALEAYKKIRFLSREKRLDAAIDFDLEAKIKDLQKRVDLEKSRQAAQREPVSKDAKVKK